MIAGTTLQISQPAITISGNTVALAASGLIVNETTTVLFASTDGLQPTPSGIGNFIFAGLNGGPTAIPSTVGATSLKQTLQNMTGEVVGGVETFQGRGATVEVQLLAIMSLILTMTVTKHLLF